MRKIEADGLGVSFFGLYPQLCGFGHILLPRIWWWCWESFARAFLLERLNTYCQLLHKIWLTQEADAKSWSSLKHVQPKEGRKELAPREIKFRCRRLDTTIRERAGSSQVPREAQEHAQESERYPPGYFSIYLFFFFLVIPNSRCSRRVFAPWKRRESPMVQNRERQPHNQLRLFVVKS